MRKQEPRSARRRRSTGASELAFGGVYLVDVMASSVGVMVLLSVIVVIVGLHTTSPERLRQLFQAELAGNPIEMVWFHDLEDCDRRARNEGWPRLQLLEWGLRDRRTGTSVLVDRLDGNHPLVRRMATWAEKARGGPTKRVVVDVHSAEHLQHMDRAFEAAGIVTGEYCMHWQPHHRPVQRDSERLVDSAGALPDIVNVVPDPEAGLAQALGEVLEAAAALGLIPVVRTTPFSDVGSLPPSDAQPRAPAQGTDVLQGARTAERLRTLARTLRAVQQTGQLRGTSGAERLQTLAHILRASSPQAWSHLMGQPPMSPGAGTGLERLLMQVLARASDLSSITRSTSQEENQPMLLVLPTRQPIRHVQVVDGPRPRVPAGFNYISMVLRRQPRSYDGQLVVMEPGTASIVTNLSATNDDEVYEALRWVPVTVLHDGLTTSGWVWAAVGDDRIAIDFEINHVSLGGKKESDVPRVGSAGGRGGRDGDGVAAGKAAKPLLLWWLSTVALAWLVILAVLVRVRGQ